MGYLLGLVMVIVGVQLHQDVEVSEWLQPYVATGMRWRAASQLKLRK